MIKIGRLTMRWWVGLFWGVVILCVLCAGIGRGVVTITDDPNKPPIRVVDWTYYGLGAMTHEQILSYDSDDADGVFYTREGWGIFHPPDEMGEMEGRAREGE
jgi:hypothetical protein